MFTLAFFMIAKKLETSQESNNIRIDKETQQWDHGILLSK